MGSSSWRYRLVVGGARRRAGMVVGIGLAILAWAHGGGWAGLDRREGRAQAAELWRVGAPAAIAVRDGRSTFQVPTPGASGRNTGRRVGTGVGRAGRSRFSSRSSPPSACCAPSWPTTVPGARAPGRAAPVRSRGPSSPSRPAIYRRQTREFHMLVRDGDVSQPGQLRGHSRRAQRGRPAHSGLRGRRGPRSGERRARSRTSSSRSMIESIRWRSLGSGLPLTSIGDGRFTILLSSWLDHLGGGRFSVDGFVRGSDLDTDVRPPFGNQCDMMYLSTELKAGPHVRTVLAHEYMHAVIFSQKTLLTTASQRPSTGRRGMAGRGDGSSVRRHARVLDVEHRLPHQCVPVGSRAVSARGRRLLRGEPVPQPW